MNLQVIKNRVGKVLAYTFTAFLFFIVFSFLVLQMPPVQNYLVKKFLKNFTQVTGFKTNIQNFRMLWFDRLELTNVSIDDLEGNRMIQAKEILINFKLTDLLDNQNVNIDGVYIDSAHVFLTKILEGDSLRDLNLNVFIANINSKYGGSGGGGGRTPRINIGEAFINQSQFSYVDQDRDTIREGFDYNHFSLNVDEGQLNSFVILGDTTEFNVETLIAQDPVTKFRVNQLSTFFRVCQTSMEFVGIKVDAGKSAISDTVIFSYKQLVDVNEFVEKVKIHANLTNTVIDPNDLKFFAPGIERVDQPFVVNGIFDGRIDKFKLSKMKIDIGNTHLAGSLDMDGLPNINETFMILNLTHSSVDPDDLAFMFNENTMQRIAPLGRLVLDGQFLGYPTDFVANGNFTSSLGGIKSDINFKVNEKDIDKSTYSGSLSLSSFDLGAYLDDTTTFQRVSMNGKILGSGLTQHTADFRLDGHVYSIGIKGYNYRNIQTNARVASERFDGFLQIDDPNLQIKARGSVDLRDDRNIVNIVASIDTAFLHNLNLTKDSIFLHADFIADTKGLTLDSLEGTASLKNFKIDFNGEHLELESIQLDAKRDKNQRAFILQTSLADAEVTGVYYLTDLFNDLEMLSKEITLNLQNNSASTKEYYKAKTAKPKVYNANVTLTLKDMKPLTKLLNIDASLSPNTIVHGTFTSGYTTIFQAYTAFDSLQLGSSLFLKSQVDLTASKISDSTNVLGSFSLNSDNQHMSPTFKTKNLLVEGIWNKNRIDFGLDVDQDGQTNYVRLKGDVNFSPDSTRITMDPSVLKILEREWHFSENNNVTIIGSDWSFHNIALRNEDQAVVLNGDVSKNPSKILSLDIFNLDLSLLNVVSKMKFKGVMDAGIDMSSYYATPTIQNELKINGLTINDFLIGEVSGKNKWDTTQQKFVTNLFIDRTQKRILSLTGEYDPKDKVSPIDMVANLEKANLSIVEPFIQDIFTDIGGTVSGEFKITGKPDAPDIRGEGTIADGQLVVNYLQTLYQLTGKVGLTSTSIYFKDIDLVDIYRNKAKLDGAILHQNFNNMSIAMNSTFSNFQVLNTNNKDNTLFYGQAYASGDVGFQGLLSDLKITSNAKTEKNTNVHIPISGASSTEQEEYITFVNFTDTATVRKAALQINKKKVRLTGVSFELNLDVTPDAYCEIIFDEKSGDIIRGRGNGDLKISVDSKGEFQMFGPFEFTEGRYNFTLYDIVNKEFEIKPGSRINWIGDPYQGVMDIDASYNQLASIYPILQTNTNNNNSGDNTSLRRKYPVQVILLLDGPMLSPTINFDIIADIPKQYTSTDGQNMDIAFQAFKSRWDEQELKRQVFSLIVLRRFSPAESFDTSGSVASSLSELLSNQLSYWMSQVDENLELDVDVASMDQASFNTF
ncbi:MAG: translocation/assembly module TamB domain-containing protein, partial [Chryseolinea sp.]